MRVEPQALEEKRGGAVQHRLTRARIPADLLDEPVGVQGADHSVHADAPDGGDLGPGHRLFVGDDGEGLERGRRQPGRLALEDVALDVGGQVGVALEAVAARHPDQLEAPILLPVGGFQLGAALLDPRRRHLQQLGQQTGFDRGVGDHHDGLDGPQRLGCHRRLPLVFLDVEGLDVARRRLVGQPPHLERIVGRGLVQVHQPALVQLEQGEKPHDHLQAVAGDRRPAPQTTSARPAAAPPAAHRRRPGR